TIHTASGRSAIFSAAASSLPFVAAIVSVLCAARSSDQRGERKWHTVLPLATAGLLFPLSVLGRTRFAIVMLFLCATGAVFFFSLLTNLSMGESAAAASLGLINSVGNLGGFVGPSVVGYLLSISGSQIFTAGSLGGSFALGAVLVLLVRAQRAEGEGLELGEL